MTDQADTQAGQTANGGPTAGNQELQIPKWRLDEVSSQLRAAREELEIKNRLLNEVQVRSQPQQGMEQMITAEESGLDPQTHQAALKIAQKIAQSELSKMSKEFRTVIGAMGNDLEATKFLMKHGQDKSEYIQRIQEFQTRHAQVTGGGYIDMESAFKIIRHDEMISRARQAENPAPQAHVTQTPAQSYPNPAMTRVQPTSSGMVPTKTFDQLTEEEMEARLNEAFAGGNSV